MQLELILSIIGFFGVLAMAINGWFLRGIFQDLNSVKISLATIGAKSEAKEKRINNLEENQKDIYERLNNLERCK